MNAPDPARPRKHSVTVSGHRTSLTLEPPVWEALTALAARRGQSVNALVAEIDAARTGPLSAAVRAWVVTRLREHADV